MDYLEDFLKPNTVFQTRYVPTGQVNGAMEPLSDQEDFEKDEFDSKALYMNSTQYAAEFQKREVDLYEQYSKEPEPHGFSTVEEPRASHSRHDNRNECLLLEAYEKYNFDFRQEALPLVIHQHREQIINYIDCNQVVIIEGHTGCGKTTQVPQFILDDCYRRNQYCKIAITQPRRLAAISIARRVCEERGWALGSVCGFQVGLEKQVSPDTILSYVTTGVLLQKLISAKNLNEYTHIIIDEVHERNQDMDFLMLIVRKFLRSNSHNVKVILMSATFNTEEFAYYFRWYTKSTMVIAPVLSINKAPNYAVLTYFADQLSRLGDVPFYKYEEPKIEQSLYEIMVKLINTFDKLDGNDVITASKSIGDVLVFLPGINEIEDAYKKLTQTPIDQHIPWHILPLHSSITTEEQRKVFLPARAGHRKIILSTNITESSITVPDICYVVDFCLTKQMIMDPNTKYQSLRLQWASHVNCTQRAGRVGRVSEGRVYRLVSRSFYEHVMPKNISPELLRAPLDHVVLGAKMLELDEPPHAVLALAMNPPNLINIETSILSLKEMGALLTTRNGTLSTSDGDLTFLGTVMAGIPLDVPLTKLIILGYMLSCLEDCIIMATGCALSNIFTTPFQGKLKGYRNKLRWADGSASDLVAYLNLYKVWQKKKQTNSFRTHNSSSELDWAKDNYISLKSLKEWALLVTEVKGRLAGVGIKETFGPDRVILDKITKSLMYKTAICGAFYPNYFVRWAYAGQVDEREAVKELGGHDPYSTVYFKNMDISQPGPLYAKRIKGLLSDCGSTMQVSFDGSMKVYVQFLCQNQSDLGSLKQSFTDSIPGRVCLPVYCSVRRRQLQMASKVDVLRSADSWTCARNLGFEDTKLGCVQTQKSVRHSILPSLDTQCIVIRVSHIIDVGHFWANSLDDETEENLRTIEIKLNTTELKCVKANDVVVGELYATLFEGKYYRCKVLSIEPAGRKNLMIQVIFIDYGNTECKKVDDLRALPVCDEAALPAQAMECVLSGVQPSLVVNPNGLWSEHANSVFHNHTNKVEIYGKIYSVVNGVVHLEVFKSSKLASSSGKVSLNEFLIKNGHAQRAEESFLSKQNHEKRMEFQQYESNMTTKTKIIGNEELWDDNIRDVEPPPEHECTTSINLRGPFSPLETNVYSLTQGGSGKSISIQGTSVNTVLLDTDPQDPHMRMLVAGQIGQNPDNSKMILQHTTWMPSVPGFPLLMALLFCPKVEQKPTEDATQIASILCGLGYHEQTKKSLYPSHDIAMTLDTVLDEDDMLKVNGIRYWMNEMVDAMQRNYDKFPTLMEISEIQRNLCDEVNILFKKKRTSIEPTFLKYSKTWGKMSADCEMLRPQNEDSCKTQIWPLHWTVQLKEKPTTTASDMAKKKN